MLSMEGKITLVKFVLLVIPRCFMSTICIHVSVCNEIEKLSRHFIRRANSESRKSTLLSWGDCCRPLDAGGISLRNLAYQNKMFLLKLGFQLLANMDGLCVRILKNKYNIQGVLQVSIAMSHFLFIWRSLMMFWSDVIVNVYWSIGDGQLTNFWNDMWLRQVGPLRAFYRGPRQPDDTLYVCDIVDVNG